MNTKRKIKNIAGILAVTAMMLVLSVSTALADAPSNDNFADATVIENIPFEDSQDIAQATIEPDDPWTSCVGRENSIWYRYTPTDDEALNITFSSGEGGTIMYAIYSLESEGLTEISCEYTMPRTITIDVIAGTTYYVELLSPAYYPLRTVSINITHPPANDDFADAEVISVIPFSTSQSTVEATVEESDPDTCTGRYKSIWYVYTPSENTSLTISANTYDYYSVTLSVYRLESEGLVQLSCGSYYQVTTVQGMTAGATYYVELIATISYPWQTYDGNNVSIDIYQTPLPEAYFSYWPGDPSIYDHIQFNNDSYDPAGIGFESCSWDFGDGSTSEECYPTHIYAEDGDYTVQLGSTTFDGRTASTTQTIQVRTHDVGITRFSVPTSARVGQTKQINVSIKNLYYEETVQVDLYKSTTNGYVWVGSLTQTMPVRPANRAQVFPFAYTFTSADAASGKVTFKAIVTIINARDAYTPDNELISVATKVSQ